MNLRYIDFSKATKHYPYRTAWPRDVFFSIGYSSGDSFDNIHRVLAEKFGYRPDNHEAYELTSPDGSTLYIFFSDWTVTFSAALVKGGH